jgi:nitrite reductase/ring-hydroxylating ferredoxin subunit
VSPFLAFLGVSIAGTWGLAGIGLVASGIILLVAPGDAETASGNVLPGIVLLVFGLMNLGLMQVVITPLLGLDPPLPVPKKKIIPAGRLTRWVSTGQQFRDLPDGTPKEVRVKSQRILLVRRGEKVNALTALCSHARLPLGGFPGSPIKAEPVRDDCIMCPFHGARFDVDTGRVVRQPFSTQFNNDHPFLGRIQSKLFKVLSSPPAPPQVPKPSMNAEDIQTYPCRVENGQVMVALKERK